MAIREGKWRCTYCETVNRGVELSCAGCGAQRDKDVTFFLEDEAPEVTDQKLLGLARAGADWLCQFCQTSNRPDRTHCVQCGAEKGTSPSRPVKEDIPQPPAPPPAPAGSKRGCSLGCAALVLLGVVALGFVLWLTTRKSEENVTVAGFEWTRAIETEALRTVRDTAWEGELPAGARVVSRSREVHHTDRVQTGTRRVKVGRRDLGNGFFEDIYKDEPVYDEREVYRARFTYEVERWVSARNEEARGGDRRPRWPELRLASNEREARRRESYVVLLQGRKLYRMELPEQRWAALQDGQRVHAVIRGGSHVVSLD